MGRPLGVRIGGTWRFPTGQAVETVVYTAG
jgi:hypothetical protein